jgi:D-alanyl-D-alanine carboxypeptidase/D-alanyl-D-alanine-endopeptidase (penicillin-binding protein 4)
MISALTLARSALLALALALAAPALAWQPALQCEVSAQLAAAGPGTRYGLVVTDEAGRELIAINPDDRFIPASNTKMFTTAAAFATMSGLDRPDAAAGAAVRLDGRDVILIGNGDARLSSAADCVADCLATLADAVAARTRRVRHVIGDDSLFPDQRWSPGMSWNNIPTRSGTAISALTLDDNELPVRVSPGAVGQPPALEHLPYYRIVNRAVTVADGETSLGFDRMPNSLDLYLTGIIRAGAEPTVLRLGIDDPAHYAAWRLAALLRERGVRVSGEAQVRHRTPGAAAEPSGAEPLARLTPPPLVDTLTRINKDSQNLHAELLIRRLGLIEGAGSIEDGVARIEVMMAEAGAPRIGWDLSDGSGMSTYNRMSPRAVAALLRWAATQSWGAAWRATFPVAGVDGTLRSRFRDSSLQGRLFAKTGTLNATNALSGYLIAHSGQTLIFSFFANDVPGGGSATAVMDAVLQRIAAAH